MNLHPLVERELARCRALQDGNLDEIRPMLAESLIYIHATGLMQGKAEWLAYAGQEVRFSAIARAELEVHGDQSTCWMTGLMRLQGLRVRSGEAISSTSFVTQVWRAEATGWQLHLLQSTRVDDRLWFS